MRKLKTKKQLILYGCSGLGVNMMNIIVGSYLCSALLVGGFVDNVASWTYLNRDLVLAGLWAVLVFIAKALDGIIDLPFATFADSLKTKLGRRRTAILMGFIPMTVSYLLFLIPLNKEATLLNTIWFGVLLCIFYSAYTLTMLTYYATFSEVTETERETLFLSNTKSICDVVYFSLGFALVPLFVSLGINVRIVALIFLPLALSMMIPFILLKEDPEDQGEIRTLTLKTALVTSFGNRSFIIWMFTTSVTNIGLQLFLGGINEIFSSTGLNMTFVMAAAFAPVPATIIVYNKLVKRLGLAFGYRYVLSIYSVGMLVMFLCCILADKMSMTAMTVFAICGALFISFSIGAFFSITYTVPSSLARRELEKSGKSVSSMYFAVQGLFEGIAAGIATGFILVTLKANDVIHLLPVLAIVACAVSFGISFAFPKEIKELGKKGAETEESLPETV